MKRCVLSVLLMAMTSVPVRAHFIWIVPDGPDDTTAQVVFSEELEPDDAVDIETIAGLKLMSLDGAGKSAALDWKKGEHAYLVSVSGKGPVVLGGVCEYGVMKRGESKSFLLAYYPKFVRGDMAAGKPWDRLPLEIISKGGDRFQTLFNGKPAAGAEVVMLLPDATETKTLRTGDDGTFESPVAKPGLYGFRARHIQAKAGTHDGTKYEEVRHYATLVFRHAAKDKETKAAGFPPLPRAVSSLGAAVSDGWLYVYGGHCAKTHVYSTESVVGTFHRLKISNPRSWEALPSGPALQGLAMVAHGGKIYRIGGMQPKNNPDDKADNHSLATSARFDPATGKWEDLPDLPEGRSSHDAVVIGDKLFVIGGWKLNGLGKKIDWHTTALVLDLAERSMKWQAVEQPFQRRALTTAVYDGKVYVVGGMTEKNATVLTVDIYDPAKDSWSMGLDIPGPQRNGFAAAAIALGGRFYISPADGRVLRLSAAGDEWEEVGQLKQPRIVHRLVTANYAEIVALGGAVDGDNIALTEVIKP